MIYVLFNKQYTEKGRAQPSQTQTISLYQHQHRHVLDNITEGFQEKIGGLLQTFACDALNDLLLCCPDL